MRISCICQMQGLMEIWAEHDRFEDPAAPPEPAGRYHKARLTGPTVLHNLVEPDERGIELMMECEGGNG